MTSVADEKRAGSATCRCGYGREHPLVRPQYTYTFWGTLVLTLGVSPQPVRVDYACGVCKDVVETISDPATLKRFRYREPRKDTI